MKNNRFLTLMAATTMVLALTACSSAITPSADTSAKDILTPAVAVVKDKCILEVSSDSSISVYNLSILKRIKIDKRDKTAVSIGFSQTTYGAEVQIDMNTSEAAAKLVNDLIVEMKDCARPNIAKPISEKIAAFRSSADLVNPAKAMSIG